MRFPLHILLTALLLISGVHAYAEVGADELATLVAAVRNEPGALERQRTLLERLSAAQMAEAIAASGNSHFSWLCPMVLRAQDYPALEGQPIARLSLMAVRGERLVPIPFQIDEFDSRGLVYIPGTSTPGPLNPGLLRRPRQTDGIAGRYDRGDELVFMYRDAGLRRATPAELGRVRVLGLLELRHAGLPPRWAYVVDGQPLRAAADYVQVDLARGTARTTFADIAWDPASLAVLRHIRPRVGPSSGRNIVDNVYGEVSTGLVQRNLRVSLNTSDNIRVQPVAVRDGPVRALLLVKVRVFYAGIPVFHDFVNIALYEQGASLLARVRLDSLDAVKYFISLIKEPRIEASIDFADLQGAQVRWQSVDDAPEQAMVDGTMSPLEERMNSARLPGDWIWMDSGRGWQFFFSNNYSVAADGLLQAFLEGMDVRMVYEDGLAYTRDGENLPGGGPRLGVQARGIPHILVSLLTSLRGTDLGELKDLESLFDRLIELDRQGKLDRVNRNFDLVFRRLREQGRLGSTEDLAALLERDIRRMGFRPADRERLAHLARRSVLEGAQPDAWRLGDVLAAMKRIAAEEGFEFNRLQYALLDNALWFPDSVGSAGPAGFDREVRNPPTATLVPP